MAYVIDNDDVQNISWDDNPNGEDSHAVIVDGVLTELFVANATGQSIVYSINQPDLEHLKTVLTDVINLLTPDED